MKKTVEIIYGFVILFVMGLVFYNFVFAPKSHPVVTTPLSPAATSTNEDDALPTETETPDTPVTPVPDEPASPVACTMDAKQCPDGSYVGRVAPDCQFAACPSGSDIGPVKITCTPESKQAEVCAEIYQPVCGEVQIQCITTPCNPIFETFSNSCNACAQSNVLSYTEGACREE